MVWYAWVLLGLLLLALGALVFLAVLLGNMFRR